MFPSYFLAPEERNCSSLYGYNLQQYLSLVLFIHFISYIFFVLFFLIFIFFILFFCLCAFADLQIEGEYPVFRMAENYGKTVQECQRFFLFLFIFLYAHFAKKF
jgi:hypothetical protein